MAMRFFILTFLIFSISTSANAETLWRGLPYPECDSFWITEFGVGWRQGGMSNELREDRLSGHQIRYDLGHMFNLDSRFAVGGTLSMTGNEEGHIGLSGRIRYWMDRNWSVDFSPGITFYSTSSDNRYSLQYPSFTSRLIINYAEFVGIYVGLEQIRVNKGDDDLDLYLGVHAASYPGGTLGALFLILGVLYAAAAGGYGVID
jgi:hypothetical protein